MFHWLASIQKSQFFIFHSGLKYNSPQMPKHIKVLYMNLQEGPTSTRKSSNSKPWNEQCTSNRKNLSNKNIHQFIIDSQTRKRNKQHASQGEKD